MATSVTGLVLWALSVFVLYWIIRLGVRHGVQDAERSRQP